MPNTSKPYKILFFRVDPGSKEKLALQGEDLSKIYEAIANSNLFEVVDLGKATLSETIAQLVSLDPDIIHFSGHGTKVALSVENYSNTDKEQAKNSTFLTPNAPCDDVSAYEFVVGACRFDASFADKGECAARIAPEAPITEATPR